MFFIRRRSDEEIKDLGDRIYQSGHTQKEFADLAGIHVTGLNRIINGHYKPRAHTYKKIQDTLQKLGV